MTLFPLIAILLAEPLGLRELQELARRNDPRARQVVAQAENARGKAQEAKYAWFPTFETLGFIAGPTPEHRLAGGDNDPNLTDLTPGSTGDWLHGQVGAVFHLEVSALLPIYTFGKLTAGKDAANHNVQVQEALLRRARDQAAFDMAHAYWGYQTARNADQAVQQVRDRLAAAKKTADKLIAEESDQISRPDRMKLDYLAEEIEAQHAEAVKNRDLALLGVRLLAAVPEGQELAIAQQDLPDAPALPDGAALLKRALAERPETKAAAEGIRARQALVELEKARFWPDVGILAGARFTDTTNASNPPSPFANNPYHESTAYAALGLRGTFDIPQKLARLHQAEADLAEVQALAAGAEQLVKLDVQQALGDLQSARDRAVRYAKEEQIGKQLGTQAGVAFDSGLGEARELLEDTLLYNRARGERLRALYDAQLAWAALEKAVGGAL